MRWGCGKTFERSNLEAPIRPHSSGSLMGIASSSQVWEQGMGVESGGRNGGGRRGGKGDSGATKKSLQCFRHGLMRT